LTFVNLLTYVCHIRECHHVRKWCRGSKGVRNG
jgi:hypothetical protein